jgi:hypothetical protein
MPATVHALPRAYDARDGEIEEARDEDEGRHEADDVHAGADDVVPDEGCVEGLDDIDAIEDRREENDAIEGRTEDAIEGSREDAIEGCLDEDAIEDLCNEANAGRFENLDAIEGCLDEDAIEGRRDENDTIEGDNIEDLLDEGDIEGDDIEGTEAGPIEGGREEDDAIEGTGEGGREEALPRAEESAAEAATRAECRSPVERGRRRLGLARLVEHAGIGCVHGAAGTRARRESNRHVRCRRRVAARARSRGARAAERSAATAEPRAAPGVRCDVVPRRRGPEAPLVWRSDAPGVR